MKELTKNQHKFLHFFFNPLLYTKVGSLNFFENQ